MSVLMPGVSIINCLDVWILNTNIKVTLCLMTPPFLLQMRFNVLVTLIGYVDGLYPTQYIPYNRYHFLILYLILVYMVINYEYVL